MVPDPTATSASAEAHARRRVATVARSACGCAFEHDRYDRAESRERALDALAEHGARRGIADDGKPASEPERRHEIGLDVRGGCARCARP